MSQLIYILIGIIVLWLSVITYFVVKTVTHYKKLVAGTNKKNLINILDDILKNLADNKKDLSQQRKVLFELIKDSDNFVQKVGILRFNPFSDTGGDQSFVLTVLDADDNGIVLTSLHSRGITRWYAKNVKNGKGIDHELSKEELKAIKSAYKIKSKKDK